MACFGGSISIIGLNNNLSIIYNSSCQINCMKKMCLLANEIPYICFKLIPPISNTIEYIDTILGGIILFLFLYSIVMTVIAWQKLPI